MMENKLDFLIPEGVNVVQKQVIKFGNPEDIKPLFIAIAKQIDETIGEFQWFPFYNDIVDWLSDDKGDGLILYSEEGKRNNGVGKCFGKGTEIMMFDGSVKNVEDIVVGDLVMGNDSTPRTVLNLARGREAMYRINQKNGNNYVVNESHTMALIACGVHYGRKTNIELKEYLKKTPTWKKQNNGYKALVDYPFKNVPIDPYVLGVWLGDGTSLSGEITNSDEEVIDYLKKYSNENGNRIAIRWNEKRQTNTIRLNRGENKKGFKNLLEENNLIGNKHIPDIFMFNSRDIRLKILAGLLDTDGYLLDDKCGFEITQKNKRLAFNIVTLARSLGFRVSIKEKIAKIKSIGYSCLVYRIYFSGHVNEIPIKVSRKKANPRRINKNPLVSGFEVESIGVGEYYGFQVDGNSLFLLSDFTVVHNSLCTTKIYPILLENYISPAKKFYILNCTDLDVEKINELRKIEGRIILIIDEMGRESKLINDFGTKIRPMETVMEIADRKNWKVVVATNLSKKGLLMHYESFHLFERIKSKCKPIECSGESKRTILK